MAGNWKYCSASEFTPIYQAPAFGFVYVWASDPPINVRWRAYSASFWFYSEGSIEISDKTTVAFGLPTSYVQFEVQPEFDALLMGS